MEAKTEPQRTAVHVALGILLVLAVATTFAPWLRTGAARRTGHEVVRAAERLEVASPAASSALLVAWSLLPLVAALALLALVRDRLRLAALGGLVVAAVEVTSGLAVQRAPRAADWGATAGILAGTVLAVVALLTAVLDTRSAP